MKETGAITRLVGTVSTSMRMGINTRESGRRMCNMGTEKSDGRMVLATKAHTTREPNTALGFTSGQMVRSITGTGTTM